MKTTRVRYSREALLRTIRNRSAEAKQESIWQSVPLLQTRAREAAVALAAALTAIQNSDAKLLKNAALVTLGKSLQPDTTPGALTAILGLRQDITAGSLDGTSWVRSVSQAKATAGNLLGMAKATQVEEEAKRWQWVNQVLDRLAPDLDEVNIEALWRASDHSIRLSIPIDSRWHKA